MMRYLILVAIGLAGISLSLGLSNQQLWPTLALVVVLCTLWIVGHWRGVLWPADVGLLGLIGLAAYAGLNDVALGWLLPVIILTLAAWDLDHFYQSLQAVADIRDAAGLIRGHAQRLGLVVGLSLAAAGTARLTHIELNLIFAITLGLLMIFGFSRAVAFIRRESD
jgi:hypothetical protein